MRACIRSSLVLNNLPMDGIMIQSVGGVISRTPKAAAKRKKDMMIGDVGIEIVPCTFF